MRSTPSFRQFAFAAGLTFVALGCSSNSSTPDVHPDTLPFKPEPVARAAAHTGEGVIDIIAGQHHDAGDVTISNNGTTVRLCFEAENGWKVMASHIYVGLEPPKKHAPGQFPYHQSYPGGSTGDCVDIDFASACGTTIVVAYHFEVTLFDEAGNPIQTETGWMEWDVEWNKAWGGYRNYTSCDEPLIPPCALTTALPADPINATFIYPNAPFSYWQTTLSNVPGGFVISDGVYNGWCVDLFHFITSGATLTVTALSSYDPALPAHVADDDWDMVNYIINNKQGDYLDVQNAIWFFIGTGAFPADPDAQAMVNDALANGEGFLPNDGDLFAVIMDAGTAFQLTFIEVVCE